MEWLDKLYDFIISLFPQYELLEPTEGGLRQGPFKTKVFESGQWMIYWPCLQHIHKVDTKIQTADLDQRLVTADDITVAVGTVVIIEVLDIEKALTEVTDFGDVVENISQQGVIRSITGNNYVDIVKDLSDEEDLNNDITKSIRKKLKPYGVKVHQAFISDFSPTKVFSHIGNGPVVDDDDED